MRAPLALAWKPAALMLCLVLPWLFAYTSAPTLNWWPWFVSALCGVAVALAWGRVTAQLLAASWLAAALISCIIALVQYFGVSDHVSPLLAGTLGATLPAFLLAAAIRLAWPARRSA